MAKKTIRKGIERYTRKYDKNCRFFQLARDWIDVIRFMILFITHSNTHSELINEFIHGFIIIIDI